MKLTKTQIRQENKKAVKNLYSIINSCQSLQELASWIPRLEDKKIRLQDNLYNRKITGLDYYKSIYHIDLTLKLLYINKQDFKREYYKVTNLLQFLQQQAVEEQERLNKLNALNAQSYRYKARFVIRPCDLIHIKGYELLQKLGYYNKDTNPCGVVMDHRYSIKDGIDNKIEPKILAQLKNCEFLSYQDNLRKSSKSSISLIELMSD